MKAQFTAEEPEPQFDAVSDLVVDQLRRERLAEINADPTCRAALEEKYGQVWDTSQMGDDFTGEAFAAPFLVCTRKSDGKRGTLEFQHQPRYYFSFMEHKR